MFSFALAAFFASGFAALLYQVIWQRLLAIFSGADVYSATVIVAAFMGGLGAGHLAGGQVADRVSRRTSLMLFGVSELAIAAFGVCSATMPRRLPRARPNLVYATTIGAPGSTSKF